MARRSQAVAAPVDPAPAPAPAGGLGALDGEVDEPKAAAPAKPSKVEKATPERAARADVMRVPHDPINEQVLLAAAIVDQPTRVKLIALVPADSFFGKGHAAAWTGLAEIERRGLSYDPATLKQLTAGDADVDYLESLVRDRPEVPPNLMHHVDMLRWDRSRIESARGPLAALIESLRDKAANPERVKALAQQVGAAFNSAGNGTGLRDPVELSRQTTQARHERRQGQPCFPFGLEGVDHDGITWRLVPGMAPKKITLLVGASGSGKSTVAMRMALAQEKAERRVLMGAWENGSDVTLEAMAAMSLDISLGRLRIGDLTNEEDLALTREQDRLLERVRFFDHPAACNSAQFRSAMANKKSYERNDVSLQMVSARIAETGADVFIGDLWERVLRTSDPSEEKDVLFATQDLMKATKCHALLLHQFKKADSNQPVDSKRPTREAIRGSSAWVDVPDTILGVYRQALDKNVADEEMEVLVLKQRYGVWPLAFTCKWDGDKGNLWGGRQIEYPRAGTGAVDTFLEGGYTGMGKRGGGRRRS